MIPYLQTPDSSLAVDGRIHASGGAHTLTVLSIVTLVLALLPSRLAYGQGVMPGQLEEQLKKESPSALAAEALAGGDPARGAIVFFQPFMSCSKCHAVGDQENPLGPDLTDLPEDATDEHLVQSLLEPSKAIRKGYENYTVITADGVIVSGLLGEETDDRILLRDVNEIGKVHEFAKADLEDWLQQPTSAMPVGQVNQLTSRQEFLDLVRYLMEIRDGGAARAAELQPPESAIALQLPEYEDHVDHAGLIGDWDDEGLQRGRKIYERVCINCHGTPTQPGSLPTSLKFYQDPFKNGNDPYRMYQTLTRGFGMMVPQTWMVPQQKYDVIHYIRETFVRPHNPSQYFDVTPEYLAQLPPGDTRGPEPVLLEPWLTMDYGPSLINTYEVGEDETNYAYKGIAVRLDPGPGGVSRGSAWMIFDHDTLRAAAGWTGSGFIDWEGIHFNGRHQVHPHIVGDVLFANASGPGWANPRTGDFNEQRVVGRDGRFYGPVPRTWGRYRGLYHHGLRTVIAYTVGKTDVLEWPSAQIVEPSVVMTRTLNLGRRPDPLVLSVAQRMEGTLHERTVDVPGSGSQQVILLGPVQQSHDDTRGERPLVFDGKTRLLIERGDSLDMTRDDFALVARIKTRKGGTIFSKTAPGTEWVPNGKAWFVRGGRLCYDIGWVGVVQSKRRVADGRWHDVALTWNAKSGIARLYVDGELDAEKSLKPKARVQGHAVYLGAAAPNFPQPRSYFEGQISHVGFYQRELTGEEIKRTASITGDDETRIGFWKLDRQQDGVVPDQTGHQHDGTVEQPQTAAKQRGILAAGLVPPVPGATWDRDDEGRLLLHVPPGDAPLRFTLWITRVQRDEEVDSLCSAIAFDEMGRDLEPWTHGGPPRWPDQLTLDVTLGTDDGPFAVDVLTHPDPNPWLAQTRFTGLDFFPDGDRLAVCAWDGDVWLVSGLSRLSEKLQDSGEPQESPLQLTWQRIASGLFQPLGLKIIGEKIYVTCRDQIVILHDLNGDGETDYYENFNNDHQVTDHFHEFAMGLQVDEQGNLYYAKGARHALPALVPHHGTLLRVTPDGSRTDILAYGFRAPNGVCVNEDGTFFLTDQEGHWTPKNRINLVRRGGYYGNFWAYHDVADPSDEAMEEPICWITNSMDRSPAELLWVDSPAWGPLKGSLLNLSYGYGKIYIVPHETVEGVMQGGVCPFPLDVFPTGIMRARFHPGDGQLYTCGMFAWAGNQQAPGGLFRVRYTGKPVFLPVELHAYQGAMEITFSGALDRAVAADRTRYRVTTWTIKRSAKYGSDHYDERPLDVAGVMVSPDGKTVKLLLPEIHVTRCMEIRYQLRGAGGEPVEGTVHNTIHRLAPSGTPHLTNGRRSSVEQAGDGS